MHCDFRRTRTGSAVKADPRDSPLSRGGVRLNFKGLSHPRCSSLAEQSAVQSQLAKSSSYASRPQADRSHSAAIAFRYLELGLTVMQCSISWKKNDVFVAYHAALALSASVLGTRLSVGIGIGVWLLLAHLYKRAYQLVASIARAR